jgi:hypothetical protein
LRSAIGVAELADLVLHSSIVAFDLADPVANSANRHSELVAGVCRKPSPAPADPLAGASELPHRSRAGMIAP